MSREIHDGVIATRPSFCTGWRGVLTDVRMSRSFLKAELKSKQIKTKKKMLNQDDETKKKKRSVAAERCRRKEFLTDVF